MHVHEVLRHTLKLVMGFPTRRELDVWLSADPYVTNSVWKDIEVHPFRAAVGAWLSGA